MTEQRGRAARWNTALVLVPGSAALFGAAVAWAADTTPTTAATSPPPAVTTTPPATPSVDARMLAERQRLEQRIATHHKHAKALAHRLAQLRTQAAKVGAVVAAPPPIVYSGGGSGGQLPAAPVQAPAPPPPPPVNANTGASGHP